LADFSFERNPDGGVKVTVDGQDADLTEQQWAEAVAYVSLTGVNEGSLAAAAMFHKGRVSVSVEVDHQSLGRVMLKQASGIEIPEPVVNRQLLAVPRR
jgi:hypothetical protein